MFFITSTTVSSAQKTDERQEQKLKEQLEEKKVRNFRKMMTQVEIRLTLLTFFYK